jgi:histidine triad (HIT) family protein
MSANGNCEFCEIVANNKDPEGIVMRSRDAIAFFPLAPATLGHTLVVPTAHVSDIWALNDSQASALAITTLKVARAVKRAMSPDGMNIIQSNGEAASQTVMHVHVHVVPRWTGDKMGPIWPSTESDWTEWQKGEALQAIRDAAETTNE